MTMVGAASFYYDTIYDLDHGQFAEIVEMMHM